MMLKEQYIRDTYSCLRLEVHTFWYHSEVIKIDEQRGEFAGKPDS